MLGDKVKVSDLSHVKILSLKQMVQRISITLAQAKEGSTSKNLQNDIWQIICFLYRPKKLLKKHITTNKINKGIIQNGYYIYKFWKPYR